MIDPELLADLRADLRRLANIMKLPEWQRDLVQNVDTDLVRQIAADFRSYNPHPTQDPAARVSVMGAGVVKTGDVGPQHRPIDANATGSGWVEAPKVDNWRPPGVDLCDRIADHFAALDRAERIREVAQSAAVQRALSESQEQELEPKAQEPKARGDKKA
jgi:hypothetical protein